MELVISEYSLFLILGLKRENDFHVSYTLLPAKSPFLTAEDDFFIKKPRKPSKNWISRHKWTSVMATVLLCHDRGIRVRGTEPECN